MRTASTTLPPPPAPAKSAGAAAHTHAAAAAAAGTQSHAADATPGGTSSSRARAREGERPAAPTAPWVARRSPSRDTTKIAVDTTCIVTWACPHTARGTERASATLSANVARRAAADRPTRRPSTRPREARGGACGAWGAASSPDAAPIARRGQSDGRAARTARAAHAVASQRPEFLSALNKEKREGE